MAQWDSPQLSVRSRGNRTRGYAAFATALAVSVVGALGGCGTEPDEPPRATPSPPAALETVAHPWDLAFVDRDDTTVTLYTGSADCQELVERHAEVTSADADQVTVTLSASLATVEDCDTVAAAVPVEFFLSDPLDGRPLVDATDGEPRPVYSEAHLPDLASDPRWTPYAATWSAGEQGWFRGYNGPGGESLSLQADPAGTELPGEQVDTMALGRYEGTVRQAGSWGVSWEVDDVVYSLRLSAPEGEEMTLEEFQREVSELPWD